MERSVGRFAAVRTISCFSPLAGIKFVESIDVLNDAIAHLGFSPLAGIKFVESSIFHNPMLDWLPCFSPLAGIKFVESE